MHNKISYFTIVLYWNSATLWDVLPLHLGSFQPGRSEVRPRGIKRWVLWILWPLKFGQNMMKCIHVHTIYQYKSIFIYLHVFSYLQIVFVCLHWITTLSNCMFSLLSLWNPGIQIYQVLLSGLPGPGPITDPTRYEERKMYRALHLTKGCTKSDQKCLLWLQDSSNRSVSWLLEMMVRNGSKLKWYK